MYIVLYTVFGKSALTLYHLCPSPTHSVKAFIMIDMNQDQCDSEHPLNVPFLFPCYIGEEVYNLTHTTLIRPREQVNPYPFRSQKSVILHRYSDRRHQDDLLPPTFDCRHRKSEQWVVGPSVLRCLTTGRSFL